MPITSLLRNFNGDPNIVTMITSSSLLEITTAGYFLLPSTTDDIKALKNGNFEFEITDIWLVYYATGIGFFTYSPGNNTLVALAPNGGISSTLSSGNILIGNGSNVATPVVMSGDATIANTGAVTIANTAITAAKLASNSVTTVKILDANVTLAKLATAIAPSHVVKFAGQLTTVGGVPAEEFTITGVAVSDMPFLQMVDQGNNGVSILKAVPFANKIVVTFSNNPVDSTVFNYQILRAVV